MAISAQQYFPATSLLTLVIKDLEVFYNELSSLIRCVPKHNVLIIAGDKNAQIVKNVKDTFS